MRKRRILAWVVVLAMIFSMMPMSVMAEINSNIEPTMEIQNSDTQKNDSVYSYVNFGDDSQAIERSGSQDVAYVRISTYEDFKVFAVAVNEGNTYEGEYVLLDANIDLDGANNQWTAIGTKTNKFSGTFDGGNHVISGLYINAASDNQGLFGYLDSKGTIKNITVKGDITTTKNNAAGIVGNNNGGIVKECGNEATVSGGSFVGGIVGYADNTSTIEGCYNSGSITGSTGYVGGVVGAPFDTGTITKNCYNSGAVTGGSSAGGVAGAHKARAAAYVNCYNIGTVDNMGSVESPNNIGAVIGANKGTFTNLYYLTGCVTNATEGGAASQTVNGIVGKLPEELKTHAFLSLINGTESAFEADTTNINNGYPILGWQITVDSSAPVGPAKYQFREATEISSQIAGHIKSAINSTKTEESIPTTETLLGNDKWVNGASTTTTDWMAFGMGRFGYFDDENKYNFMYDDGAGYETYLEALRSYMTRTYEENGGYLHTVKATEWHRAVVAITALGGNPLNFGVYQGRPIDLIADGSYNNTNPGKQGINGWIWGLISMDTVNYAVPADAKHDRQKFITEILKLQLTDGVNGKEYGGWTLSGQYSDPDISAMAIQSLSPYYNDDTKYTYINKWTEKEVTKTVREAVDETLDKLGEIQREDGDFSSWGSVNSESTSWVLIALTSLGIDPAKDERFITSEGKTLLDGILKYQVDGGFGHTFGGGWNSMANDQATYALVSYWRLENGMRGLYDARGNWTKENRSKIDSTISKIDALDSKHSTYKADLKSALVTFRTVDKSERRYVYNYSKLAKAIEIVGGEDALDTDGVYITDIGITNMPTKITYNEGEKFDPTGLILSEKYSNNSQVDVAEGYTYSPNGELTPKNKKIVIKYKGLNVFVPITVTEKLPWEGNGTEKSPYIIKTPAQLFSLAKEVDKGNTFQGVFLKLADDINLSIYDSWVGIGRESIPFQGTFDGDNHVVKNLTTLKGGYKGIFGVVGSHATIKNLGLESGNIELGNSAFGGGIAAYSNGANIINCFNGANITGSYCGGIVGTVRYGKGTIEGCYNIGTVTGNEIGGIVGHISSGDEDFEATVKDCYNAGNISTRKDSLLTGVGGIVGKIQGGNHKVSNCYNVGGIINNNSDKDAVNNIACIVGQLYGEAQVENCYYNSELGVVGIGSKSGENQTFAKTSDEMKSVEFMIQLNKAENIFKPDFNININNGYPIHVWKEEPSIDNSILSITMGQYQAVKQENNIYTIAIPKDMFMLLALDIKTNHSRAKVSTPMANDEYTQWTFTVTAQNGANVNYILNVTAKTNDNPDSGSGSGSSSGGGGGGAGAIGGPSISGEKPVITIKKDAESQKVASAAVKGYETTKDGQTSANVSSEQISSAVSEAVKVAAKEGKSVKAEVKLEVKGDSSTKKIAATIPVSSVKEIAKADNTQLKIASPVGDVVMDSKALSVISDNAAGKRLSILVEKTVVGDRPAVELSVKTDKNTTVSNFGKGLVKVYLPYKLAKNEKAAGVVVKYVAQDGTKTNMPTTYDTKTETATFETNHFSCYVIEYDEVAAKKALNFIDVKKSNWYFENVMYLVDRGIITGKTETSFAPNENITRAEFVAILARMSGQNMPEAGKNFIDVKNTSWYAQYVTWAVNAGIAKGTNESSFSPNANISRQDMAVMITRYADYMKKEIKGTNVAVSFIDEEAIAGYAKESVITMQKAGIINGVKTADESYRFAPKNNATRSEASKMIYELVK